MEAIKEAYHPQNDGGLRVIVLLVQFIFHKCLQCSSSIRDFFHPLSFCGRMGGHRMKCMIIIASQPTPSPPPTARRPPTIKGIPLGGVVKHIMAIRIKRDKLPHICHPPRIVGCAAERARNGTPMLISCVSALFSYTSSSSPRLVRLPLLTPILGNPAPEGDATCSHV